MLFFSRLPNGAEDWSVDSFLTQAERERERGQKEKMYKILKSHLGENRKEIKVKLEKQKRTKEKHDFVNTVPMNKTQKGA